MSNLKNKTQNPKSNKLFLITRNGLEELKVLKKAKMCIVVNRNDKKEYIYHTRTIINPSENDFKTYGKIKK